MTTDRDVVWQLERKVGLPFAQKWEDDRCVAIDLTSDATLYHGLIRHHAPAEQQEILVLLCRLRGLRRLNLLRNRVRTLPPEFCELTQLEWLNLSSNELGPAPPDLGALRKLRFLHLAANHLISTPEWLASLTELEDIGLHKNMGIRSIEPLAPLRRLRSVNLFFLSLQSVPAFLYEWRQLRNLVLWNCTDLTNDLARLEQLEFFTNCGAPGLRELPPGLTRLRKLRFARLFQNSLQRLPEDIGALGQLEHLSLYQNELTRLPDSFADLTRLKRLNLGWNRFAAVPGCVAVLRDLEWFAIFGNPLQSRAGLPARGTVVEEWPLSSV